ELFTKLRMIALENNFENVVDGSNYDDLFDFRPGSWAKSELGVRSPLQEAGLTKEEIRRFSQLADLPTWDRPPMACLASRIPYGTKITSQILWQVGKAEKFLKSLGFRQVRVRHHGDLARIEVGEVEIDKVLEQKRREKIVKELEKLGYLFVSLDLKGYRSGSLNLIRQ
ncbi:MAG: TIGR00268 family protein, partial [Candidatus Margulisiibacteriota bacterium]